MRILISAIITLMLITACSTHKVIRKVNTQNELRNYKIASYTGPKKKLAVSSFKNNTRFGKRRLGENLSDILITELNKTNQYILLERTEVDKILNEKSLSMSGLTTGTLQNSKLKDADYIVSGAVTKYAVSTSGSKNLFTQSKLQKAEVSVDLRIIDVRTGEIVLSESGEGVAEKEFSQVLGMGASGGYDESLEGDAFRSSIIKLMENIVKTLSSKAWQCDVVKVSDKKLYLNAGKKSNLKKGTKLKLISIGEKITDLNGDIIGFEEKEVGVVTVVNFIGENGGIAEIKDNMILRLPLICRLN